MDTAAAGGRAGSPTTRARKASPTAQQRGPNKRPSPAAQAAAGAGAVVHGGAGKAAAVRTPKRARVGAAPNSTPGAADGPSADAPNATTTRAQWSLGAAVASVRALVDGSPPAPAPAPMATSADGPGTDGAPDSGAADAGVSKAAGAQGGGGTFQPGVQVGVQDDGEGGGAGQDEAESDDDGDDGDSDGDGEQHHMVVGQVGLFGLAPRWSAPSPAAVLLPAPTAHARCTSSPQQA